MSVENRLFIVGKISTLMDINILTKLASSNQILLLGILRRINKGSWQETDVI